MTGELNELAEWSGFVGDNSAKEEQFQFLLRLEENREKDEENDLEIEEEVENEGDKEEAMEEN